jgi:hypothetical protein
MDAVLASGARNRSDVRRRLRRGEQQRWHLQGDEQRQLVRDRSDLEQPARRRRRDPRLNPSGQLDNARGIRHFVVGTGGAAFYGFGTIQANSEVRNSNTFGVAKFTLHSNSYTWQFVPQAGKTFTDSGTTACH